MKHTLIILALTMLPMSSHAEKFDSVGEAIHAFSIEAQKCSLYLDGSLYHLSDSDVQGEQLAAKACIKFMSGYSDIQKMGITQRIEQLPDELIEGNTYSEDVRYMNSVYQSIIEEVWLTEEPIDNAIQKELDEEKKDIM